MSKMKLPLLTALLVLMVVSLTVLVPSGAVTDEALSRYEDALWEPGHPWIQNRKKTKKNQHERC